MKLALTGVACAAATGPEGTNETVVAGRRQASAMRALLIAGAACAGLMTGLPALAADAESATNVDEVVVTANKMSATTVLKAPTSIQAISGETLQKQGVVGFMDIARQVPGLSVQDLGPGDRKYVIRGISSAGASTTGVYYDEAVVSGSNANDGGGFQSDIRLYDLDRIEVLRGPQGTLYGAGSMSGTIRFLTKKPNLSEFGGYVSGEFSHTEKGGDNYNANGAINLPILEGKAALRLVGWGIDDSGFVDQVRVGAGTANPRGFVADINTDNVLGGRATLRVEPIDDLTIDASYTRQSQESNGSSRYTPSGVTAFKVAGAPLIRGCDLCNTDVSRSPRDDDLEVYSLTVNYRTPYGTLTGTTNQYNRDFVYNIDQTPILAVVGVNRAGEAYEAVNRNVNSSEIRFASNLDFPVNFVVGGFRQDESSDLDVALLATNGEGLRVGAFSPLTSQDALRNANGSTFFGRIDHRENQQYAAFGEATWSVTEQLKLTGGLRYFHEKLNGVQQVTHPFGGFPPGANPTAPVIDPEQTNDKVTGKVNISYAFSDDVLVYATASQGFRSGGLNPPSFVEFVPPSFGPDTLWNYEIGAKGRLFGRALEYQVNAFWIDWKDIQVQQVTQTAALHYIGNAGNAVSKGVEFEFTARPIEYLRINFAGSLQDAHLKQGATPAQIAKDPTLGRDGDKLPDVPKFQYALGLDYSAPLAMAGGDWNYTLAADITYQGKRHAYFEGSPFDLTLDSYTLVNVRAGLSNDLWSATLFVRNLTDKRAQVSAINSNQDPHALITVRPRTIGMTVTRNF
jgi:iron complex outermembrane receptor protein